MLALAVLGPAACANGPAATASEVRITNTTDLFQYGALSLAGSTDSESYTWQNTGPRAQIDVTPALMGGGATLTVRDPAGTLLYQEDVRDDIDTLSPPGTPGAWSVRIDFDNTVGSFTFTLKKQD
jgi:hypothetical protein